MLSQIIIFLVCLSCNNKVLWTWWLMNIKNVFLTVLEAGISKIKVPADLASVSFSLIDVFSPQFHMTEGGSGALLDLSYKCYKHIHEVPPSWPHHLPKASTLNTITLGITISTFEFGEENTQCTAFISLSISTYLSIHMVETPKCISVMEKKKKNNHDVEY